MANGQCTICDSDVRERVGRFLNRCDPSARDLTDALDSIRSHGRTSYLFGGAIRDLMVGGASAIPRDIDIVVGYTTNEELMTTLKDRLMRRTRFGGLRLNSGGWLFDVWPLKETWAFREGLVSYQGFSDLPKTTFLDVEAVVAELSPKRGRARRVYTNGFFEAFSKKTVDINLEENPYPELCVIRSLITAAKLRFSLGPRLTRYVVHHGKKTSLEELVEFQKSHYGRVYCPSDELNFWIKSIEQQARRSKRLATKLPISNDRQLKLWTDDFAINQQRSESSHSTGNTPSKFAAHVGCDSGFPIPD